MAHHNEQTTVLAIRRIIVDHLRVCPHCQERWQLEPSAAEIFKALAPVTIEPDLSADIWTEITTAVAAELAGNGRGQ